MSETVDCVITEERGVFAELRKHSYDVVSLDRMADIVDRIEAAHKREMADEKRISDAVVQSLRDKKLEMAGEIAEKEAEVSTLRALVDELADKLECCSSMYHDLNMFHAHEELDAIVASARRVIRKDKTNEAY